MTDWKYRNGLGGSRLRVREGEWVTDRLTHSLPDWPTDWVAGWCTDWLTWGLTWGMMCRHTDGETDRQTKKQEFKLTNRRTYLEGTVTASLELWEGSSVPDPSPLFLSNSLPPRDPPGDEDSWEGVGTNPGTLRDSSASLASNFLSRPCRERRDGRGLLVLMRTRRASAKIFDGLTSILMKNTQKHITHRDCCDSHTNTHTDGLLIR